MDGQQQQQQRQAAEQHLAPQQQAHARPSQEQEASQQQQYGVGLIRISFPPKLATCSSYLSAPVRLFCFPPSATGASVYHGWAEALLPAGIQVMPVEMPGQGFSSSSSSSISSSSSSSSGGGGGSRSSNSCSSSRAAAESRPRSMRVLVERILGDLNSMFREKPFALFGHSMGSWVAYEVAHALENRKEDPIVPLALFASGRRPPLQFSPSLDVDPTIMHTILDDGEFWVAFFRRYGDVPSLSRSEAARKYALPLLRADFESLETYEPSVFPSHRLRCPVTVLGAEGDSRCTREQLLAWREHAEEGKFSVVWFSGGHWYIRHGPEMALAAIREGLADLILRCDGVHSES